MALVTPSNVYIWANSSANVSTQTSSSIAEGIVYQSNLVSSQVNGALQNISSNLQYIQKAPMYWRNTITYPQGSIVCLRVKAATDVNIYQMRFYMALSENSAVPPTNGTAQTITGLADAPFVEYVLTDAGEETDDTGTWLCLNPQMFVWFGTSDQYAALTPAAKERADILYMINDLLYSNV